MLGPGQLVDAQQVNVIINHQWPILYAEVQQMPCRIQQFISDPAEKRFRDAMVRGATLLPVHQRGSVCLQHRRQDCYSGRCEAEPAGGNTLFPPARRANSRPNPAGQRLGFLLFHGGISCHAIG